MYDLIISSRSSELVALEQEQLNEQVMQFKADLLKTIGTLVADGDIEVKTIIALNKLTNREYSQHEALSLENATEAIDAVKNKKALLENNIVFGRTELVGTNTVYICVDPEDENIADRISNTLKPFVENNIEFVLNIYINTSDRNTYELFESNLRETIEIPYTIVSRTKALRTSEAADKVIYQVAERNITVHEVLDRFSSCFGLSFSDRKLAICFSVSDLANSVVGLEILDLLLIAGRNIRNLVLEDTTQSALAGHVTDLWYQVHTRFKYMHEVVEDFFNAPTVVLVKGLTPLIGWVVDKRLELSGSFIDGDEEEPVKVNLQDASKVAEITEGFDYYLGRNIKNLRNHLIKYNGRPLRVDRITPKVVVKGRTLTGNIAVDKYEIEGDLSRLTLIAPYYLSMIYNKLSTIKGAIPYGLPEQFNTYLYRQASTDGVQVPDNIDKWFQARNARIGDILQKLATVIDTEKLLGSHVSGEDGLLTSEILVKSEDMAWHTKTK